MFCRVSSSLQRFSAQTSLASHASRCVSLTNNSNLVSPLVSFAARSYAKKDLEEKRKEKKAKEALKAQQAEQAKEKEAKKKNKDSSAAKAKSAKPKPRVIKPKEKSAISAQSNAAPSAGAQQLSNFFASHQTVDFSKSLGLLGYESKLASVEAFDSFIKDSTQNFEQIFSDIEKGMKSISAADLVATIEKLENIKARVTRFASLVSASHPSAEAKAATEQAAEKFLTNVAKRYHEFSPLYARANGTGF